mmetsp:Transcript_93835/g.201482  ORF Transcript_93835/g.201482 Transcript_93835/m.201482 type:complete len:244 (-) Transcript_93835:121-852(-)
MGDEEDTGPKLNKASIDDEFLRHPHSGAFIRNPLLEKSRSSPVFFQVGEYNHNCLDDALGSWQTICVSESGLKALSAPAPPVVEGEDGEVPPAPAPVAPESPTKKSSLQFAAISRLANLPHSYDFTVSLQKSTYVAPRANRRRPIEAKTSTGTLIDKVNIEVSPDATGKILRVENINEGLITVWNKLHPDFQMRTFDHIVKVNGNGHDSASLIEEFAASGDNLKILVRRSPQDGRGGSKLSII